MAQSPLQLDLSSLEGPPINDSRFSTQSWSMNNPRICVLPLSSYLVNTSPRQSLPQGPASMDVIPDTNGYSRRQDIENRVTDSSQHVPDSLRIQIPNETSRAYREDHNRYLSLQMRDWEIRISNRPSNQPRPSNYQRPRPHTQNSISSNRMVWQENENIWLMLSPVSPSPSVSALPSSAARTTNWSTARRPPLLQNAGSIERSFHNETTDIIDPPPPYQRHYLDRPLPPLPWHAWQGNLNSGSNNSASRGSLWSEMARRIGRSPVG